MTQVTLFKQYVAVNTLHCSKKQCAAYAGQLVFSIWQCINRCRRVNCTYKIYIVITAFTDNRLD